MSSGLKILALYVVHLYAHNLDIKVVFLFANKSSRIKTGLIAIHSEPAIRFVI